MSASASRLEALSPLPGAGCLICRFSVTIRRITAIRSLACARAGRPHRAAGPASQCKGKTAKAPRARRQVRSEKGTAPGDESQAGRARHECRGSGVHASDAFPRGTVIHPLTTGAAKVRRTTALIEGTSLPSQVPAMAQRPKRFRVTIVAEDAKPSSAKRHQNLNRNVRDICTEAGRQI